MQQRPSAIRPTHKHIQKQLVAHSIVWAIIVSVDWTRSIVAAFNYFYTIEYYPVMTCIITIIVIAIIIIIISRYTGAAAAAAVMPKLLFFRSIERPSATDLVQ